MTYIRQVWRIEYSIRFLMEFRKIFIFITHERTFKIQSRRDRRNGVFALPGHPRYAESRDPAMPTRHRLLYGARESCYAASHAIACRIPHGDLRGIWRARIVDIVNTPVKPRVMQVKNETRAGRDLARLISRERVALVARYFTFQ